MKFYEHMKHEILQKVVDVLPNLGNEVLNQIARVMDEVSSRYTISEAELGLSVLGREEFERIIKTYIVVKGMEGISKATLENYILRLKPFMEAMIKPITEITANDIRLYLFNYQNERGITNRSMETIRITICSFFKWATGEGYIEKNPAETIKPIKFTVNPRKALDQIELELIRRACTTARETALIETLYSTGCRVSELTGIKLSDIDWNNKTVLLFGKGSKFRTSYINAKAEVAIKAYLHTRTHDSIYLFCNDRGGGKMKKDNVQKIVRILAERAGLGGKKVTPHVFRHTTATQALKSGMPVVDIQKLLGHSNVATTMVYAHTSTEMVQREHKRCII